MVVEVPTSGKVLHGVGASGYILNPSKPGPLSRVVHVPPCTAELSLSTRGKAFFLLFVEGEGGLIFLMPRPAAIYIGSGALNSVLTVHAGT
jgi:hypothetical protein